NVADCYFQRVTVNSDSAAAEMGSLQFASLSPASAGLQLAVQIRSMCHAARASLAGLDEQQQGQQREKHQAEHLEILQVGQECRLVDDSLIDVRERRGRIRCAAERVGELAGIVGI